MARRYALLDDQWERIKDWLPERAGQPGAQDNRLFVNAVLLPGRHPLARSVGTFRRLPGGASGWRTCVTAAGATAVYGNRSLKPGRSRPTTSTQ